MSKKLNNKQREMLAEVLQAEIREKEDKLADEKRKKKKKAIKEIKKEKGINDMFEKWKKLDKKEKKAKKKKDEMDEKIMNEGFTINSIKKTLAFQQFGTNPSEKDLSKKLSKVYKREKKIESKERELKAQIWGVEENYSKVLKKIRKELSKI